MKKITNSIKELLNKDKFNQILYIIPGLAIFCIFYVYPTGTSVYYSFTDWNGISKVMNYVGFDNYIEMFSNKEIFTTIPTTIYYATLNTVSLSIIGFFVALALNRESKITNTLRVSFFMPMLVGGVIVGFVFREIYSPVINEENMGTLNQILTNFGFSGLRQNWLGHPNTAMIVVVLTGVWNQVGTTSLIYLAGMQSIPKDLYEAAKIDGAGYWRQTYNITWKLIAPALTINMIFLLINSMKAYDMIAILTQGGPGTATKVINIAIMNYSVSSYKVGLGAAMSMVVAVFVLVVVTTLNTFLRKREVTQ